MSTWMLPVGFAIFIWWFSTGLVLLLDNLPRTTFRWSVLISSVLALAALLALSHTAGQTSVTSAYCAFTSALMVWAWHELTFLTGWLTGPRKQPATPGAQGWQRFSQAVAAILWHELGILVSGVLIVAITWGEPNQVGTGTFLVLWVMRTSAKLNLFLGVRNLSEEFLPPHLLYMGSHFRRRPMNVLWPFSISGGLAVLLWYLESSLAATGGLQVGGLLVATMLAMAIVEHGLLVLPLPSTALWRWAMRRRGPPAPTPTDTIERTSDDKLLHAR
jgi:putative photosynthetic complex assembly protein 2